MPNLIMGYMRFARKHSIQITLAAVLVAKNWSLFSAINAALGA